MPSLAPSVVTSLADRFTLIIAGLRRVAGHGAARDRTLAPLLLLLWIRLRRMASRFEALAARVRAGLPPPPPPARRHPGQASPRAPDRLPRGIGWLVKLLPEAASHGGQLEALLADPALADLLAEAPQAGRILRPLCRMLAIRPGPAALPARREPPAGADPPRAEAAPPAPSRVAPEPCWTPAAPTGPPLPA